jgi:methionyl-tRNA formyltransferase
MRIAFLGTPQFAVPVLEALISRHDTICVFTQPDRPVGRKAVLTPPPVKVYALAKGLPVKQFEKIRSEEGIAALSSFQPDLLITAAFGQLLSAENLAIPKFGTINVHASLLPKYRGASPIQAAILNGDTVTGVTTMFTDVGMDTGDILLSQTCRIEPYDTYETLSDRLSLVGADLLVKTLQELENGTLSRIPQNDLDATVCRLIRKQDGKLDFNQSAKSVFNRVRAMYPWPCAYSSLNGQQMRILDALPTDITRKNFQSGMLIELNQHLYVNCADYLLEIRVLQMAGKKPVDAASFLRGNAVNGLVLI